MVAQAAPSYAEFEGEKVDVLAQVVRDEAYIWYCAGIRKRQIEAFRVVDGFALSSISTLAPTSRWRDRRRKRRGAGLPASF